MCLCVLVFEGVGSHAESNNQDKLLFCPQVWSLEEGSCLMTLTGHHDAVTCLNLTFDGTKVISGSLDHNLKFWDLATGKVSLFIIKNTLY